MMMMVRGGQHEEVACRYSDCELSLISQDTRPDLTWL